MSALTWPISPRNPTPRTTITYPRKCLEAEMVALDSLDLVAPGISSITVHNKSHMAGDGALLQGADEGLAESLESPFCRGRTEEPVTNAGEIEVRHDADELPRTQRGLGTEMQ